MSYPSPSHSTPPPPQPPLSPSAPSLDDITEAPPSPPPHFSQHYDVNAHYYPVTPPPHIYPIPPPSPQYQHQLAGTRLAGNGEAKDKYWGHFGTGLAMGLLFNVLGFCGLCCIDYPRPKRWYTTGCSVGLICAFALYAVLFFAIRSFYLNSGVHLEMRY